MISLFDQGSRASKSEINRQRPDRIRARNSPVPIHCSTVIPAKARINTSRHSREGGNPQFPRMREFIVPLPRHPRKTPRHSREGENQYQPSFPRRRESIPSVIPAKAGIHNSRVRFPRRRESTIPAHAGIHRPTTPTPEKNTPPFQRRRKSIPAVIPAKANPQMREFIVPLPRHPRIQYQPSFPRRRESTIPAYAGIHRPTTPTPEKNTPPFQRRRKSIPSVIPAKAGIHNSRVCGNSSSHYPDTREKHPAIPAKAKINTSRHSREGGNPQFPRMREFIVPLPRHPRKTPRHSNEDENQYQPSFPRRRESTIPAYAGIHRPTTPTPEKNTPPFQRRRKSIPAVIPAKAGIHNSRACGNSSSHYPDTREKHPAIPAKAKINTIRHSREGGNPQFPRMREFIVPLPRHPRKTPRHSREGENDVDLS